MTKVAIVTGGSRGIGRACALRLADAGYAVVVNYAAAEKQAHEVVAAIKAKGGSAVAVKGDVAKEADVLAIFAAADRLGPLAALVNNAGAVDQSCRVEDMGFARLRRMFDINVIGTIICAREAVKRMSTKHGGKGGSIVNIGSKAADLGSPGVYVDYAAAKGAVDSFTLGLGLEVAAEGIRVNAIRPGIIETDIHASGGNPDRVAQMAPLLPMKRAGLPEEVAEAVLWMLSDAASYVTATSLNVSGGR